MDEAVAELLKELDGVHFGAASVESTELALARATLLDGVREYIQFETGMIKRQPKRRHLSRRWLWATREDEDGPFGFVSLCEAFGIEPDALRLGVVAFCARAASGSSCKR